MDPDENQRSLQNRENNELLLNAIKNKFAASTTTNEASTFTPPKLNIPNLKTPPGSALLDGGQIEQGVNTATRGSQQGPPSTLNKFLLDQLSGNQGSGEIKTGGFALPKLQFGGVKKHDANEGPAKAFVIPLLNKSQTSQNNINTLCSGMNKISVDEPDITNKLNPIIHPAIDLSTALSSTNSNINISTSNRLETRNKINTEYFDIPFIECDRIDNRSRVGGPQNLPMINDYCLPDISKIILAHSLNDPSPCGRIICHNRVSYRSNEIPHKRCNYNNNVRHKIKSFDFNTKSPDDVILATLNKYQRQHHT